MDGTLSARRFVLKAIVNHHGTLCNGHYTSIVNDRDRWLHCDDHNVILCSKKTRKSATVYPLFYQNISLEKNL